MIRRWLIEVVSELFRVRSYFNAASMFVLDGAGYVEKSPVFDGEPALFGIP
jgi:hypothetical protein